MPHVVLLGDSIFDNAAYTSGKPDVLGRLRQVAPRNWKTTLLARDGATTDGVRAQLAKLPADATDLVLSVGGNNALMREDLLHSPAASTGEAISLLGDAVAYFELAYRDVVRACLDRRHPLIVCTIYNGNFSDATYRRRVQVALALFNDVIIRTAIENRLKVIELRLVCALPEDYANQIEPSTTGAVKIAQAIAAAVAAPPSSRGALVLAS